MTLFGNAGTERKHSSVVRTLTHIGNGGDDDKRILYLVIIIIWAQSVECVSNYAEAHKHVPLALHIPS